MIGELRPATAVELAVVERSGLRESSHIGAAVVLDGDGETRAEHGDAGALIYPRSTMKLFQAVALRRLGVHLEGEELVMSAASHIGTPDHVRVVRSILSRARLTEDALQCPVDWPMDAAARHEADAPSRVTMGCSGKHAAFLLACVHNGWPVDTYLHPDHPLQKAIRETVEEFVGERIVHSGIDGCGAPVHAMSLRALARGASRVARGIDDDAARLADAIRRHPWVLDNRVVRTVITETGMVAKSGAEGVFVAGEKDGTAVAVRVLDGSQRALAPVALSLLMQHGALGLELGERVTAAVTEPVLGAGLPVGSLYAVV
ncbi:L-asparaginase II [Microbacteriaceae bacterium SG_E_30_P1]|uniref:L-asparaginase II n=1 Tax=Antiquaquibacter oligotrophicus TaxID=2880260 RepID=A0ABT6KKT7_9MICO|nr:asparaginase [Antiquaquibacter oligotrophicus]MDH6180586.1 L-asparaginase II [Antiquaquibacter oligotrophicus]UDF13681.1 asparaginase [Antiquaquibacter oligotrophicus]